MKFNSAYHKEKHIVIDFSEEELKLLVEHLEMNLVSKCAVGSEIESIAKSLKSYLGRSSNAKKEK